MDPALIVCTVAIMIALIDHIWLGYIAKRFYRRELGESLRAKPRLVPAVGFYIVYAVGVTVFVLNPALDQRSIVHAIVYGALFGSVAYATYDLTNLAVTKGFVTTLALVDIAWGAVLTGLVAALGFALASLVI